MFKISLSKHPLKYVKLTRNITFHVFLFEDILIYMLADSPSVKQSINFLKLNIQILSARIELFWTFYYNLISLLFIIEFIL